MAKRSFLQITTLFVLITILFEACKKETLYVSEVEDSTSELALIWYQNDMETKNDFEVGLRWCFSFLGAELSTGSWENGTRWEDNKLHVDFSQMGFNQIALEQITKLNSLFKESGEFELKQGIDGGRWVAATFNTTNHYYKIVGIPDRFDLYKKGRSYLDSSVAVINSGVAFGNRIIQLPVVNAGSHNQSYIASELSGSIEQGTHSIKEFEVMDIMPNGQPRFGVYDSQGRRISGANNILSNGGKPSKCLWCHETNIQPSFLQSPKVSGYLTTDDFNSSVKAAMQSLTLYRTSLNGEIDFTDAKAHEHLEKLYIRYYQPSLKRLAQEMGVSQVQAKQKLLSYKAQLHEEFPEMGRLYIRNEVQTLLEFSTVRTAVGSRETEIVSIDLLP
ncbi:MAG: hypothetical protein CL840_16985 [Crocinitomicaceae bacterium]|nr:hypothetical protein [Crocinitomicaceae bacterium]|tara:strand:- start:13406 stop:14572 length:1167 start_codon:yes stop_codon:yes gene_type:complete